MNTPRVLHIVKWYPHATDPQNGVFVQKQIHAVESRPAVLGFLNHSGPPEFKDAYTLYGSTNMSSAAKWGAYFAKLKEIQPEIIHFHCYAPDLAPLLWFAKRAGLKTVHSEHWSGFLLHHPKPLQGWRRAVARWYMRNCHLVLPVSPILAEGIKALEPAANTEVLPNVVEEHTIQKVEKRPCTSICVVADVVFSIKQQDTILEIFSSLPRMQYELHFYGGGPDESKLKHLVKPHSNVFWHGRKSNEEILKLLPQHHALVLFSTFETFGITVFEARQAGLWAIAKSDFGGAPYYDQGCILVDSKESLRTAFHTISSLAPSQPSNFADLGVNCIKEKLSTSYSKLLFD